MAGKLPVVGASVQLYAAGTSGNGSAGTSLLTSAVTTDSSGAFSVAASSYSCPATTSVLYLVATGGSVSGSGSGNSAIAMMSSPGACSAVTSGASYTLNELTTVASAYAFAQFLSAGAHLGSTATNVGGLTLAAGTLANLVNVATGATPGAAFPSTGTAPVAMLDSLANAVNACVTTSSAGSAACSSLFSAVTASGTPPANTLDAMLAVAKNPVSNGALYALTASGVYSPTLAAQPSDWTMFVNFTGGGMSEPSALSIDSKGNVWVANYGSVTSLFSNAGVPLFASGLTGNGQGLEYGGAVDANDVMWTASEPGNSVGSSISLFTSAGTAAAGSPYTAGGLDFPLSIAVDATNVSWIVNYGDSSLTLLSNSGSPLSGSTGLNGVDSTGTGNFIFPVAVAVDSNRNGWVANQSSDTVTKVAPDGSSYISYVVGDGPSGVAVDTANNVWVANYYGNSIGIVSAAGKVLSGTGITGGGIVHPQGIAVDGANNVWVANYRGPSLSELAAVGSSAGTGTVLSPAVGWGPDAALLEAFGLAIDASGNVWVTNFATNTAGTYTLTEFVGLAAPVKTPLLGPVRVP